MSRSCLFRNLLLLFFGVCSASLEKSKRNIKVIKIADFQNKKITEIPMKSLTLRSNIECIIECKQTDSCLSFSFNNDSKDCEMYAKDFVNVAETTTIDERGWNYHYIMPGGTIDKAKCMNQNEKMCRSFCLFYKNGFSSKTVQDFMQTCSVDGGEVFKVDRYLKHYSMVAAIDPVLGNGAVSINGMQNETTGEWRYYDGTKMTYFYWGPGQPDYVSPSATPGKYEGTILTRKKYNYSWQDAKAVHVNIVVCEIK